ncbi:MAG: hypothetical protein KC800_14470 [Candidatus Eremiobacteraeota bacterium]|nr:hypothetical protein [Candidatus Eremiobacteraeota bacterium]
MELLIDQRLVGFLKPVMSLSSGPLKPQSECRQQGPKPAPIQGRKPAKGERAS